MSGAPGPYDNYQEAYYGEADGADTEYPSIEGYQAIPMPPPVEIQDVEIVPPPNFPTTGQT